MSNASNHGGQPQCASSSTKASIEALKGKIAIVEAALTGGRKLRGRRAELRPWDEDDTATFVDDMFRSQGDIVSSMLLAARLAVGERWCFLGADRFRLLSGWPGFWWTQASRHGGYPGEAYRKWGRLQRGMPTFEEATQIAGAASQLVTICTQIAAHPPSPEWMPLPPYKSMAECGWTDAA